MDPLSITVSCLTLIGIASKTSVAITTFIRGCRAARSDLTSISGELTQLQLVLELLKDDTDDQTVPETLRTQILSIIANCSAVVDTIDQMLQKHGGKAGPARWTAYGKTEVEGLRMSLQAHRGSLSLVLELVSISLSKATKEDTSAIRTDVRGIKQDTSHIPQIMAELTRLREIVAAGNIQSTTRDQDYMLERYLDGLTSYAESVCDAKIADPPSPSPQGPHNSRRARARYQSPDRRNMTEITPTNAGSRSSLDTISSTDSFGSVKSSGTQEPTIPYASPLHPSSHSAGWSPIPEQPSEHPYPDLQRFRTHPPAPQGADPNWQQQHPMFYQQSGYSHLVSPWVPPGQPQHPPSDPRPPVWPLELPFSPPVAVQPPVADPGQSLFKGKLVVVGDCEIGKTTLVRCVTHVLLLFRNHFY